jgi:predicted PurR-regulated permease PerM
MTGVSMLVTGVGTGIGLALLGIQQWAALAVLAGIFSFIPNFGPILALVPAVAVGMVQVPDSILLIILIVYGVSFIQSQLVAPILASEGMNLAPVLILAGQIVFGIFFGFMGILLAVPITAIGKVLIDEIFVKDILGDVPIEEDTTQYDEDDLMPDGV